MKQVFKIKKIKYCESCKLYTLKEKCPKCQRETKSRNPPKFSPEDRYGKYRREIKKKIWEREFK